MKDLKKTETEKVRFSLGVDYLIICIKVIYKKKHGKFSPNQKKKNRVKPKKPSPTGLNRFLSLKTKPNRNRSVWTGFGSFFFNFGLIIFFYKNRTESKIITPKFRTCLMTTVFFFSNQWKKYLVLFFNFYLIS